MSLCYLLLYSVLLPLGNMAAPRGRPISVVWAEILLFGQMDTAGTISPSSSLHVCPPRGHLTSAHFDEHVFFFFFGQSFPSSALVRSNALSKWITKIT